MWRKARRWDFSLTLLARHQGHVLWMLVCNWTKSLTRLRVRFRSCFAWHSVADTMRQTTERNEGTCRAGATCDTSQGWLTWRAMADMWEGASYDPDGTLKEAQQALAHPTFKKAEGLIRPISSYPKLLSTSCLSHPKASWFSLGEEAVRWIGCWD